MYEEFTHEGIIVTIFEDGSFVFTLAEDKDHFIISKGTDLKGFIKRLRKTARKAKVLPPKYKGRGITRKMLDEAREIVIDGRIVKSNFRARD